MTDKKIKYAGLGSIFFLTVSLYICGYAVAYERTKFDSGKNTKDYSISYSLANGSNIGMTILFTLGFFLFLYMLYHKFTDKKIEYYFIICSTIIIYCLVISMIFYNPFEDGIIASKEHGIVAGIAFTVNLILNVFVVYNLFENKYSLIFLEISFYLSLIADVEYYNYMETKEPLNNYKDNYFPIAENINLFFFILTVFLLTFNKLNNNNNKLNNNNNNNNKLKHTKKQK